MARPIRETPILIGDDAARFVVEMQKIDNLTAEQRAENNIRFQNEVRNALSTINVCF